MQEFLHKFDLYSVVAGAVGSLVALGFMPKLTFREAITVLAAGTAVAAYLAPLAMHYCGFPGEHPAARAFAFLSGLCGMRICLIITTWAEKIESPQDLLKPFRRPKG